MDIFSPGAWRFPQAGLAEVDGRPTVILEGVPERVLPAGVRKDDDVEEVLTLKASLHDVWKELAGVVDESNLSAAGERLLQHCRTYSAPDLCQHGQPRWHMQQRGGCRLAGETGRILLDVARTVSFVERLTALRDVAELLRRGGGYIPTWPHEALADLATVNQAIPRHIRRHLRNIADGLDGVSDPGNSFERYMVSTIVDDLMVTTWLHPSVRWERTTRPELALKAETTTALYVADLLRHIGTDDEDRTFICVICGLPVTKGRRPKPGERVVCTSQECQRERLRLNQAALRARRVERSGQHEA